jgi:hypothetical protein
VDCGGEDCDACANGLNCLYPSDCESNLCVNNTCEEITASCSDTITNGNETDVDCGGEDCNSCANDLNCNDPADCESNSCVNNMCTEIASTCSDTITNGNETDVDCGGEDCDSCANGLNCIDPADCESTSCVNNVCTEIASTCLDNITNGNETDVDCGGEDCNPCTDGRNCIDPADCESNSCTNEVCQISTCIDSITNGNETDVDCGGGNCNPCIDGLICIDPADCESSFCDTNICGYECGNLQCEISEDIDSCFDDCSCPDTQSCDEVTPGGITGCFENGNIPSSNSTDCSTFGCAGNFQCHCNNAECTDSICIGNCGVCPSGQQCEDITGNGNLGCLENSNIPANAQTDCKVVECNGNAQCWCLDTDCTNSVCVANCSSL